MKALDKEKIIKLIQDNFQEDETIFEDDRRLKAMWEQFGDDYFIAGGRWILTKKNDNW